MSRWLIIVLHRRCSSRNHAANARNSTIPQRAQPEKKKRGKPFQRGLRVRGRWGFQRINICDGGLISHTDLCFDTLNNSESDEDESDGSKKVTCERDRLPAGD